MISEAISKFYHLLLRVSLSLTSKFLERACLRKLGRGELPLRGSSMAELPTGKHWSAGEGVDGVVPRALSSSRA